MRIGIYNPHLDMLGGGEKSTAVLAETLSSEHDLLIVTHHPFDKRVLEDRFSVDLRKVSINPIHLSRIVEFLVDPTKRLWRLRSIIGQVFLKKKFRDLHLDMFINHCHASYLPASAPIGIYMCMFPQRIHPVSIATFKGFYELVANYLALFINKGDFLSTYQHIWANSMYTGKWVKIYWDREATVLYPPCEDIGLGQEKKKVILSVGRFFHGDHQKRPDFLIEIFKKLNQSGWELHLAGSLRDDMYSQKYITQLQILAEGFPIYFHPNISFGELRSLYQKAMIYWHAAGYDQEESRAPHKLEHFGISTVEAMSAGAVPIVIGKGGQREIVEDGISGFLWETSEELINKTHTVLSDADLFSRMSLRARKRSEFFRKDVFVKDLLQKVQEITSHD